MATITSSLNIVAPFLVIAGVVLVLAAFNGRRRVGRPFCARCRYELTETINTHEICPECGADISIEENVRWHAADFRWGLLILGVVLLISPCVVKSLL